MRNLKRAASVAFAGVISMTACHTSPAAAASPPAAEEYALLEAFHGHACPGSLFGLRLGVAAKEALASAGGTGRFTATYYDHSCPIDGIQVGAGTTYGNGAITIHDRNERRLVLTAGNKKQVEARLTQKAEEVVVRSRALQKQLKTLAPGTSEKAKVERERAAILEWFKTAPTREVVTVKIL